MNYEFYLPFPPTVNNYYVKTARGVFISQKGRKFRAATAEALSQQLGLVPKISDRMFVDIILFPPDLRKRDVDNYNKSLLDAITDYGLWEDDSLIDQLMVYRGEKIKNGQVFVRLTDAGPVIKMGQEQMI